MIKIDPFLTTPNETRVLQQATAAFKDASSNSFKAFKKNGYLFFNVVKHGFRYELFVNSDNEECGLKVYDIATRKKLEKSMESGGFFEVGTPYEHIKRYPGSTSRNWEISVFESICIHLDLKNTAQPLVLVAKELISQSITRPWESLPKWVEREEKAAKFIAEDGSMDFKL